MHTLLLLDSIRVLVTGATGFIGTHLCRSLLGFGAEVHGVSRRSGEEGDVHWWTADLSDPEATRKVVQAVEPEVIFHLAAHVSGTRDLDAVRPTLQQNLVSTVNVMTAACGAGKPRVLLAGSMEEDEGARWPSSPYAAAKTAGAAYGRMFYELYDLPVVNLRTYMTYGPGQADSTKLIPYVTTSLLRGEAPRLSSGDRPVDWIYIDDVVDAYLAAAVTEGIEGTSIAVGSGELVTVRSVVEQLVELTGSDVTPEFGAVPDRPFERVRKADITHTREAIGWQATVPLREGLARTVDWFRESSKAGAIAR